MLSWLCALVVRCAGQPAAGRRSLHCPTSAEVPRPAGIKRITGRLTDRHWDTPEVSGFHDTAVSQVPVRRGTCPFSGSETNRGHHHNRDVSQLADGSANLA